MSANARMEERLLCTKEAAIIIGMAPSTLNRGRVYGNKNLPAYLKIGKAVRYRLSTLITWMENQQEYVSTSQSDVANS